MTPFYNLLIVAVLFFSCKKDEESELWTEVHVSATNYVTGEPINDIIVGVYERKTKLMLQDSEVEVLKEELLVNGQFNFGWKAKKNSKYAYEFAAATDFEKYYKISMTQFAYLDKGEIHNYDLELIPYAKLIYNIENQNCFDVTDTMWFKRDHALITYQSEDWNPLPRTGCYSLFSEIENEMPIGDYEFTMKIKRNGVISYITKNITLHEGETKTIELFY
ncbi:MAG: hypothetical protein IPO32_17385 [Crocinitomicaceae bacterium]|nr:hypothetical protein [Crocinitomicaceae bacterium]